MSSQDIVKAKAWFKNIHNYENLSHGGARTLSDIEKVFDCLVESNAKLRITIEENKKET